MKALNYFILIFLTGLLLSSCYTQLAIVKRENVYIPQEETSYAENQDSTYTDTVYYGGEDNGGPYITQNYYFDDLRLNRYRPFGYDPWFDNDFYFDLGFYGNYGYPGFWSDYYMYAPYATFYPPYYGYYWNDWYWRPRSGRGPFKHRPFVKNGRTVRRGGSRTGFRSGHGENGGSEFKATQIENRPTISRRSGSAKVVRRTQTGRSRVTRIGRHGTVRAINSGKNVHRKVVYIKRKSSSRTPYYHNSRSRAKAVKGSSKKVIRKSSSSGSSRSKNSGERSSNIIRSSGRHSYSAPVRSSSSRSSSIRSSSSSSSRSSRSSGSRSSGSHSRRR